MSDQYIGEIRYFTYMRGAPEGWLRCDGSAQSIQNYEQLFALIGTTYGGDGQNTFGLPDLRGRVAIGAGGAAALGNVVGVETVTLNSNQIPPHNHVIQESTNAAGSTDPTNQVFGSNVATYFVPTGTPNRVGLASNAAGITGLGLPHENCAPTLTLQPCICFAGIWPQNPN